MSFLGDQTPLGPGTNTPACHVHYFHTFSSFFRLWIIPKEPHESLEAQQIGYINVVPARNEIGSFNPFDDTLRKFNEHLRHHPIPGEDGIILVAIQNFLPNM